MKKEMTTTVLAIVLVFLVIITGSFIIKNMSGVSPPFTVVESESMQHSNESQIGIIDTADMILVRTYDRANPSSYVEGFHNGTKEFGDYGSVIIYKRPAGNPVIHRAILWMEYNGVTWSAPSLEFFNDENGNPLWGGDSTDFNDLHGNLTLTLKSDYRDREVTVRVNDLVYESGYITMGDNNSNIDQNSSNISYNRLVNPDRIKSVAWKEIPWIGAIKLAFNGNMNRVNHNVPNTVPCLAAFFTTMILIVISMGLFLDYRVIRNKETKHPHPFISTGKKKKG